MPIALKGKTRVFDDLDAVVGPPDAGKSVVMPSRPAARASDVGLALWQRWERRDLMRRSGLQGLPALCLFLLGACSDGEEAFDLYLTESGEPGAPIAGAQVAIDLGGRVEQTTTDAAGRARVVVPAGVDAVTITAAREGYLPVVSIQSATRAELRAETALTGGVSMVMSSLPLPPKEFVHIAARSDVPFCAAGSCTTVGMTTLFAVRSAEPLLIVAYSIDDEGCPVELREVTLPDARSDQTVTLAFDGTGRRDPTLVPFAVRLPADPESSMQVYGLRRGLTPLTIQDVARNVWVGGACRQSVDADGVMVEMTAGWFAVPGEQLSFQLAFGPNTPGSPIMAAVSTHRLTGPPQPGAVYDVLDVPRVAAADSPTLGSRFSSQPIDGAERYALQVMEETAAGLPGRSLWLVWSFRPQALRVPELPEGYSPAGDWPTSTAGLFRLRTCSPNVNVAMPMPPGGRCSMSAIIAGALTR